MTTENDLKDNTHPETATAHDAPAVESCGSAPEGITLEQARAVIAAHREAEDATRIAEMQQYLGRYYRYENSYSLSESWPLYGHVREVNSHYCMGLTFQRTPNGIEIEPRGMIHCASGMGGRAVECSAREFWDAAEQLRIESAEMLTRRDPVQTHAGGLEPVASRAVDVSPRATSEPLR